eukprot:UN24305
MDGDANSLVSGLERSNVASLTRSQSDSEIDSSTGLSTSMTRSSSSPVRFRYRTERFEILLF